MNKYRWIALILTICLLLGGCASRKAPKQIESSPYLRASGTKVVSAVGKEIKLVSNRVVVSAKQTGKQEIEQILSNKVYNSLTLQFSADLVDCGEQGWYLSAQGEKYLQYATEQCRVSEKYLLVEFGEYPEQYLAMQDEEKFIRNIASLWGKIAKEMSGEAYFASYIISNIPRPIVSEEEEALSVYEQYLAQICASIRTEDELHMISVEMMPYMNVDKYHAFPYVKDHNFTYVASPEGVEFYTEQNDKKADGIEHLIYPNSFWHNLEEVKVEDTIYGSEITTASMDYQTRATHVIKVEQEGLFARIGASVIPDRYGGGELRVLSVRFVECDETGKEKRVIYNLDSSVGTDFECRGESGFTQMGSVYDDGTAYLESISESTFFYVSDLNIPMEMGKYYQLTVTMKQRGMNSDFECTPAVQLYTCEQHNLFDAEMLKNSCETLFAEAQAVGVPLIFNDIGVSNVVTKEKGKEQYLSDMITVIDSIGQNYIAY